MKNIDRKMNNCLNFSTKKSRSLFQNNQTSCQVNPEKLQSLTKTQSNVKQMIFQKYNFKNCPKTKNSQSKNISKNNKSFLAPATNVIVISKFSKAEKETSSTGLYPFLESNKIKTKQKQNSFEIFDYAFVQPPSRKISDYKECIKRIKMNSTYRGFDSTKNKFGDKNTIKQNQRVQTERNQDSNKATFKAAERKRIIQYMIQKGFARKMEDSLIKVRNQKKKIHNNLILKKNTQVISPSRSKRTVLISQTESLPTVKIQTSLHQQKTEQEIEPW